MSEFPDGWASASFLEVFDVQGGGQPPKSTFVYEPREGFVQLLQIRDFGARPVPTYIQDTENLKKCRASDILIARYGASLGRILTGLEGAYNVAMAKVAIPDEIDRRFAFNLLNSEMFQAPLRLVSRSAQNGFNKEDLAGFQIAIAPLNEQKRIADKLDAVLARVDACRDRLDRIPTILKRFRQSVLAAATSGKLTEDWRSGNPIENTWSSQNLGDYVENCDGKRVPISEILRAARHGNYPYYGASGVIDTIDGYTHDGKYLLIGEDGANLFTRSKPIAFIATGKIWVNNHAHVLRCRAGAPEEFLGYFINSIDLAPYVSGSAQPKLNQKNMNSIIVPVPPVEEQTEIVRRVESLFACADRLEARYTAARAQVEKLTPATLAKAFRGELVPQDPNDEPASVLLERIRTKHNDQSVNKPKRGRQSPQTKIA